MTIEQLTPFEQAITSLAQRKVMPTNLGTAELRKLGTDFHRQNFTSARTLISDLLDGYKEKVAKILNPTTVQRTADGGQRTEVLDVPTARLQIKELQKSLGMGVTDGTGPLTDLRSDARINLVIKTNTEISQGAGWFIQSQDRPALDAFPAQELFRLTEPRNPGARRNWQSRWEIAGTNAGDTDAVRVLLETGRMIARKDSPIWQQLGSSKNFDDGLDNPFPPFAFNSGMDVRDISYEVAVSLDLIQRGQRVQAQPLDEIFKEAA